MRTVMVLTVEKKRALFKTVALIFYGLFFYLLFLAITFPKEKVERWFFIRFQEATRTEMTVGESRFTFPFGTEWKQIVFIPAGKPEPRLVLDQLNVDFLLSSLFFKGSLDARFILKGWGGDIRGMIGAEKKGGNPIYFLAAEGEEIDLKQFPWKKGLFLEGKVRFQTEYRWNEKDPVKGNGFLNIEGNGINGRGLSFSGFTLPELTLYKLTGHGVIREGRVTLDRLNTTGSLADLNGTGTVLLEIPLEKSLLNISMKLTPKEALNKVIPLALLSPTARAGTPMDLFLKGTFDQPLFTLTGAPS